MGMRPNSGKNTYEMLEVNKGESNCIPQDESRPPEPVSEQRTEHDPDCYFNSDEDPVPLSDGQKHCGCIIWFPKATNICCLRKDISTDPNDHHRPSECLPITSFSAHDSNSKWFSTFQRVCNPCITHSSIKKRSDTTISSDHQPAACLRTE